MLDIKPVRFDSGEYDDICRAEDKSQSTNTDQLIGDQMSKETFEAMSCMMVNPTGPDEDLWQKAYESGGSCIGLSVNDYFSLISRRYQEFDPNKALFDLGITNRSALVKTSVRSDELKAKLDERVGKNTLYVCNTDYRDQLSGVELCLETEPPYQITDCPVEEQLSCADFLILDESPGTGQSSEYCKTFMPNGIFKEDAVNDIEPNENDGSSSSNLGIILGATIGGVAALMALILLVIILRRRKRSFPDVESMKKKTYYASDGSKSDSTSVAAPSIDFDPFITWLKSVEQRVGPVQPTHPQEFSASEVIIKKPIGEGSFGKVCA